MSSLGSDPATTRADRTETEVGSVFVSNYPAYSFWSEEDVPQGTPRTRRPDASPNTKLGLYLHIPFCRKRCKFCYFRVYTDKNSQQIQTYLDALAHEVEHYAQQPAVKDRPLHFIYFGGGTSLLYQFASSPGTGNAPQRRHALGQRRRNRL